MPLPRRLDIQWLGVAGMPESARPAFDRAGRVPECVSEAFGLGRALSGGGVQVGHRER